MEAEAYKMLRDFVREVEGTHRERREHAIGEARRKGHPASSFPTFVFFRDVMETVDTEDGDGIAWVLKGDKDGQLNVRKPGSTP